MIMNDTAYSLPFSAGVLIHGAPAIGVVSGFDNDVTVDGSAGYADILGTASVDFPTLLRDMADMREFNQADALAASGDYFITLATRLDLLAQAMPRDSAEQIELENLVNTLFYLQKHYIVIAKHKLK
jgi:hypothetical protein